MSKERQFNLGSKMQYIVC